MIVNIIAFLEVKLVFHGYNKMVRCSSCISMGKFFFYQGENLVPAVYPFTYSALLTEYEMILCCINFGIKKEVKQSLDRP
jgi:hypothetical protein